MRLLTTNILDTYHICNPQFRYESTHNPRRVLTKPSKPAHNDGYDNEDYDYILYVNDWLGSDDGHKYVNSNFSIDVVQMTIQIFDTRHPGARHLWPSGQMPEYENPRDCSCQSSEEQASLLQSKYDGSDNLGIG